MILLPGSNIPRCKVLPEVPGTETRHDPGIRTRTLVLTGSYSIHYGLA